MNRREERKEGDGRVLWEVLCANNIVESLADAPLTGVGGGCGEESQMSENMQWIKTGVHSFQSRKVILRFTNIT